MSNNSKYVLVQSIHIFQNLDYPNIGTGNSQNDSIKFYVHIENKYFRINVVLFHISSVHILISNAFSYVLVTGKPQVDCNCVSSHLVHQPI